jgi:hypothetical protein
MSQKGQITKHEWGQNQLTNWKLACIHCKCEKAVVLIGGGPPIYKKQDLTRWQEEQPPCISRLAKETGDNGTDIRNT